MDILDRNREEIYTASEIWKKDFQRWLNINSYKMRTVHRLKICEITGMSLTEYNKVVYAFPIEHTPKLKEYIYKVAPHLRYHQEEKRKNDWQY